MRKMLLLLLLPCLLCACADNMENDIEIEISPDVRTVCELVSQRYTDEQLDMITQIEGSITVLDSQYPIECVRKTDTGYRVSYLGEEKIAIINFDAAGNKISGFSWRLSLPKSTFDNISHEHSVFDVENIDPNGMYHFLYTGRNDVPQDSTHYTSDGYMVTIKYGASYQVIGFVWELV